jgi:hypothetical protein
MIAHALSDRSSRRKLMSMAGRKADIRQPNSKSEVPTMSRIYPTLKNAVLTAAFALLPYAAVSASAQNTAARVDVPFPFVANHVPLPAGHYEIISSDTNLRLIDASTGKGQAMLLVRRECGTSPEGRGRLTFKRSGSQLVLSEVQFAGSPIHSVLLAQPIEERVVAQAPKAAGATIELALR